jgi:hypothetical protein
VGDLGDLVCRLVNEFKTEMPNTGALPRLKMAAGLLGFRTENCVPATNVGHDCVCAAIQVAELDAMALTGMSAVLEARAVRQEAAEDAVLGMEDGQMLVGDDL